MGALRKDPEIERRALDGLKRDLKPSPVPSAPSALQGSGYQFWIPQIQPAERGKGIQVRGGLLSGIRWCGHVSGQDSVTPRTHDLSQVDRLKVGSQSCPDQNHSLHSTPDLTNPISVR